jgi:hypothetical protein
MPINGRINVDVLFHDTDGTTSLKVVSLEGSTEYTTGKVAIVTGTAGTTAVTVRTGGPGLGYRDSSGQLVTFSDVRRVLFAWNGSAVATLRETGDNAFLMTARAGEAASTSLPLYPGVQMEVSSGSVGVTGTYTVVIYGT